MGEIIALRQMSGGEYDAARAAIGKRNDAKPKWDQELCKLLTASGWATEALARKEGIHVRTRHEMMMNKIQRDTEDDIRDYLLGAGFKIEEWKPNQYVGAVVVVKAVKPA